MDKLQVDFGKLTRREQMIYAHATFTSHFKMASDTIAEIESWIIRIRIIWLIVIAICTVWLVIVFRLHGIEDWRDYILVGTVAVTFSAGRLISFIVMRYVTRMLRVIQDVMYHLATDASLKISFEDMAARNGTMDRLVEIAADMERENSAKPTNSA